MKTHVAIYNTQENAKKAIEKLSDKNFPIEKVSILEKGDVVDDHIKVKSIENIKIVPILIFSVIGLIVGVLSPILNITYGFEFMEDVTPIIGGFIGFDVGLLVGGFLVIVIAILIKKDKTIEMETHMENSRFLILVDGEKDDIIVAENILNTVGSHSTKYFCTYCNAKKVAPLIVN